MLFENRYLLDTFYTFAAKFRVMNVIALKEMAVVAGIACIIVFFAMMIDLASGLYKAKQRHEFRSSWGLKRTLTKFITYEGGMMIAYGVDLLIYFSRLFELFHLAPIVGIPVVSCLVGIFLLVVEFLSIREKSDKKTKKDFSEAGELITKLLESKTFKDAFMKAIEVQQAQSQQPAEPVNDEYEPTIE